MNTTVEYCFVKILQDHTILRWKANDFWQTLELLSNLVYGIQAAFSVDCSSSCLPSLKMTLLTTKVNKLNP